MNLMVVLKSARYVFKFYKINMLSGCWPIMYPFKIEHPQGVEDIYAEWLWRIYP